MCPDGQGGLVARWPGTLFIGYLVPSNISPRQGACPGPPSYSNMPDRSTVVMVVDVIMADALAKGAAAATYASSSQAAWPTRLCPLSTVICQGKQDGSAL